MVTKNHTSGKPSFEDFFESNPLPTWIYDIETLRFLDVNNAAIEHYGYTRDEFLAMTIKEIRPPEDIPKLMSNISEITEGLDLAGNWRHIKKDGSLIEVDIHSHTIKYYGRNAEMVTAIDLTERSLIKRNLLRQLKETEEVKNKLAVSESLLSLLLSSVPACIAYVDDNFHIQWANREMVEFFAWGDSSIRGIHVKAVAGENAWAIIQPNMSVALAGEKHHYIAQLPYKNIGPRWMRVTYTPDIDDQGKTRGVVVHMINIDEVKKLEKENVRNAQLAMIGQFAAGVVHELNNPINGILNCSQLLQRRIAADLRCRTYLEMIDKEGRRISELTKALLFFARDETEPRATNAMDVLEDTARLVRKSLLHQSIELVCETCNRDLIINVIPQRIEQVLLNLISNAQYALLAKTEQKEKAHIIKMSLEAHTNPEPLCRITVFDNGIGIPAEKIDQVCKPFMTTKPASDGTGLGLSISADIIAEHSGNLKIQSEEGAWTRIIIDLPLAEQGSVSNLD